MTVSYAIDPWDPGYGVAFGEELDGGALEESSAELNLDLETPGAQWRPVDPDPAVVLPGTVLFLDGVRRIDARVWGARAQAAAGPRDRRVTPGTCGNGRAPEPGSASPA